MRGKKVEESELQVIKDYLESEKSTHQIAKLLNCKATRINWIIKSNKLFVKNKCTYYNTNKDYFNEIDTEKKAYILGFIIADGCISKNRLLFCNSIDDIEIIEIIKQELSPNSIIRITNNQTGVKIRKPQVNLRINSKEFCDFLSIKYDILPNKTKNSNFKFNFNFIPEHLISHFIRGYFDGDGSVSCVEVNNSIAFDFSFVFNSIEFTNQIANILSTKFDIRPVIYNKTGKTCNYQLLRFDYNQNKYLKAKDIYNYLYNDSSVFLTRKKIKFEEYFKYRANSTSKQWRIV